MCNQACCRMRPFGVQHRDAVSAVGLLGVLGTVPQTIIKSPFSYTDHSTGSDALKIIQRLFALFIILMSFKTNQL